MYYIGFCILTGLYIKQLQKKAETEAQPVVVTAQKVVLDACPLAQAKGVLPGSAVSVAKAILGPQVSFIAWKEETYAPAQEEWLGLCEKYTDAIEPINQHSAYLDLSAHGQPDDIASLMTQDLAAHGFNARIGVGGNKWTAELTARHGDPGHIALIMPRRYVGGFPISVLPCAPSQVQRLALLGCHRIADILAIPISALRAQFGDDALQLRKWALGGDDPVVRAIYPKHKVSAVFWPSSPVNNSQELDHCLEILAQRLGEKLESQDKFGHALLLIFEREDLPPLSRQRTFAKPIFDGLTAMTALRALAGQIQDPIAAMRAQMGEVRARDRHQPSLEGPNDARAKQQKADLAMQSMQKMFGEDAVRPTSRLITPRQIFLRAFDDDPNP